MNPGALDIVAIGDAIVDVIATAEDSFLQAHGLTKGSMQLLTTDQADALYSAMGPAREVSGGSAANSMAGVAALGLDAGFIGQIANDQLGDIFQHDMRALGVRFETPPLKEGPPTGRCLILVTPDAQRTMNTCPGASHELTPQRLDENMIRSASITFLEGYLWGPERPRHAMLRAAQIAHEASRTVAFTLSESLCIYGYLTYEGQVKRFEEIGYFPTMIEAASDSRVTGLEAEFYGGQKIGEIWAATVTEVPVWYQSPYRQVWMTAVDENMPLFFDGSMAAEELVDLVVTTVEDEIALDS